MKNKSTCDTSTVEQLLEAAVEAEKAGLTSRAESLLVSAQWQERANHLEGKPRIYWAEGSDLLTESADGSGPCEVFSLQAGQFDMAELARLLNQDDGAELPPRPGLTSATMFVEDSEYLSRDEPLTVFNGFSLSMRIGQLLNSERGLALLAPA